MPALKIEKLINLLPEEYAVSSKSGSSIRLITRINRILAIVSAAVLVLIGGVFAYENVLLRREVTQNQFLKQDIIAHEDSEQKLVLIKDRLEKVSRVLNQEAEVDIARTSQLINKLPSEVVVRGILFSEGALKLNLVASSSSVLTKTLSATLSKEIFQIVNLTSFGFQPDKGYTVALELK